MRRIKNTTTVSLKEAESLFDVPSMTEQHDPRSKYTKHIIGLDGVATIVDVYRVQVAFGITDPEILHAHKKLSMAGARGKGDKVQDVREAIISLEKWLERNEQEEQYAKGNA